MKRTLVLAALAVVSLVACGDDDDTAADSSAPVETTVADTPAADTTTAPAAADTTTAPAAGGPVEIEHRYGTTVFESAPQRIVSLDTQWTDVLTALDAPMAGVALDPYVDGGRLPWQSPLPDDVEGITITTDGSIPFEAVAALQPDLIVVTYAVASEADYDRLTGIAPTIPLLSESDQVDPWQTIATAAGEILGKPDEAARLITDAEELSASVKAELPGLEGKTYALVNYVPGDAIYVVVDPNDGASQLFNQLGMEIEPDLLALGVSGRATLSHEQIGELDADMLLMLTNGAETSEIVGYDALPAVKNGAVTLMDYGPVVGINTPTPLSIPYCLDLIRPSLEAVATAP